MTALFRCSRCKAEKVRGLLCHPCNVKLHALDKWPHYRAALGYLGGAL